MKPTKVSVLLGELSEILGNLPASEITMGMVQSMTASLSISYCGMIWVITKFFQNGGVKKYTTKHDSLMPVFVDNLYRFMTPGKVPSWNNLRLHSVAPRQDNDDSLILDQPTVTLGQLHGQQVDDIRIEKLEKTSVEYFGAGFEKFPFSVMQMFINHGAIVHGNSLYPVHATQPNINSCTTNYKYVYNQALVTNPDARDNGRFGMMKTAQGKSIFHSLSQCDIYVLPYEVNCEIEKEKDCSLVVPYLESLGGHASEHELIGTPQALKLSYDSAYSFFCAICRTTPKSMFRGESDNTWAVRDQQGALVLFITTLKYI